MNAGMEADLKKDDLLLGVIDVETGLLLRFSSRCLMLFLYILNYTTLCYWYVAVYWILLSTLATSDIATES